MSSTCVFCAHRHYTGHFKAVINKPQNVFVMRDVACASYVAGCNTMFFGHLPGQPLHLRYDAARARTHIMRRLSFADEMGAKYHSCMSFAVSALQYESGDLDTVMSVTTRLLPWEINTNNTHDSFPGGEEMFREYDRILNLKQIHYGEDVRAAENMEFISQGATNNALCFMGPHRKFSRISRSHFELVPGQGHFGPDALPGVSVAASTTPPLPRTGCWFTTHVIASLAPGRTLEARRDGLAEDGARPDDFAGGGGVEPAGLPATRLSSRARLSAAFRRWAEAVGSWYRNLGWDYKGLDALCAVAVDICSCALARVCVCDNFLARSLPMCV